MSIPVADTHTAALTHAGTLSRYTWRVEIRPRRQTLGITVRPDTTIVLAVPATFTPQQLVRAVQARKMTIIERVLDAREQAPQYAVKELVAAEGFDWLGCPSRLRITDMPGPVRRVHDEFGWWMAASRGDLETAGATSLIDWYSREGTAWATERAAGWAPRLQLSELPRLRVRALGPGRWGAYRPASHTVDLHWPLFQLPCSVAEYVLVRQLVHATRPAGSAHGAEFRMRLDRVWPSSWQVRRRLDEVGRFVWAGEVR